MKMIISQAVLFILLIAIGYLIWPEAALDTRQKIDKILVIKHERKLIVYSRGIALKTYTISLGGEPVGAKQFEGDQKTPEGRYYINDKNPHSAYHLNLGISYPNETDILHAKRIGKKPGGQIKIHGLGKGWGAIGKLHRFFDWTQGCIALTNDEIEELYNNVPIGTMIEIIK